MTYVVHLGRRRIQEDTLSPVQVHGFKGLEREKVSSYYGQYTPLAISNGDMLEKTAWQASVEFALDYAKLQLREQDNDGLAECAGKNEALDRALGWALDMEKGLAKNPMCGLPLSPIQADSSLPSFKLLDLDDLMPFGTHCAEAKVVDCSPWRGLPKASNSKILVLNEFKIAEAHRGMFTETKAVDWAGSLLSNLEEDSKGEGDSPEDRKWKGIWLG
ncbi:hypothetical protein CJ030_MR3G009451 [Morella rubra]|uniref:Uncharacterized protein n=1 Tax=Morella rubra TaxID=262757 RepID=A0A6A1W3H5_9ROSI|nr:hypothetical protein CJ030_MR3G009451 [Morella rubra]